MDVMKWVVWELLYQGYIANGVAPTEASEILARNGRGVCQ